MPLADIVRVQGNAERTTLWLAEHAMLSPTAVTVELRHPVKEVRKTMTEAQAEHEAKKQREYHEQMDSRYYGPLRGAPPPRVPNPNDHSA